MVIENNIRMILEENGIIVDNFNDIDMLLEKINDKTFSTDLSDPLVVAYLSILKNNKQDNHYLKRILKYHQIYELDDELDDKLYSAKEIEKFIKDYSSITWDEDVYDYNKEFVKALFISSIDMSKELINAHNHTYNNKKTLQDDRIGICYVCKEEVRVEDILEYIDNGKTAICPYCNAPTVIPISISKSTNKVFLEEMLKRWYQDKNGKFIDGVAAYDNFYLPSANFSFDRKTIIKGYNAYYNNKINSLNVSINRNLTRILSNVKDGHEIYKVDIRIKNDNVKFVNCTCNSDTMCAHEYASIIAYIRDYYSYKTEIAELNEIIDWLRGKDGTVNDDDVDSSDETSKLKDLFHFITSSTIAIYSMNNLDSLDTKSIAQYTLEEAVTYITKLMNEYRSNKMVIKTHIDNGSLLMALEKILKFLKDKELSAESMEVI